MPKKLSIKKMRAGIYARRCDLDPDFASGYEAATDDEEWTGYPNPVQQYWKGERVLKKHTLRFAYRSTVHTMSDGSIPGEDEAKSGFLRIKAGYIGTAQAYETAIFNPRS